MKTSNDLFLLIKSLTKTEKRYFKVTTSKGQELQQKNNYIKLFDVIERQKEYNEEEIISKFHDQKFIKHLSSEKNYLYNLILKTLRRYHSKSNNDTVVEELLHYSEILYQKGLFNQSEKIIAKSRKLALERDMLTQTIKISKHYISLSLQHSTNSKMLESNLLHAISDSKLALKKLQNLYEYYEIHVKFLALIRKEGESIRSATELAKFDSIIKDPLMTNENMALTNDAKTIYFFIKHTYHFIIGEHAQAYAYYKEAFHTELSNNTPFFDYSKQMKTLSNFCEICVRMKKYDEALLTLEKIKNFQLKSFLEKGKQFYRYHGNLLSIYTQTGHFEKAVALIDDIEVGIEQYKNIIHKSKMISIYYHISYAYFGIKDYKNALKWVNPILNDTTTDLRKDILCFARILHLIIHFETKNTLLIEHLIKSSHYYFSTREKLHWFEKNVLTFFSKSHLISDENQLIELFTQFHSDLVLFSEDPYGQITFDFLDLQSWIESKIYQKDFAKIIISKNKIIL